MPKSAIWASCRRPCFHGIRNRVRLLSSQATPSNCPWSSCDTSQGKIRGFWVPMLGPAHTGQFLSMHVKEQMHSNLRDPFAFFHSCFVGYKWETPSHPSTPSGAVFPTPASPVETLPTHRFLLFYKCKALSIIQSRHPTSRVEPSVPSLFRTVTADLHPQVLCSFPVFS